MPFDKAHMEQILTSISNISKDTPINQINTIQAAREEAQKHWNLQIRSIPKTIENPIGVGIIFSSRPDIMQIDHDNLIIMTLSTSATKVFYFSKTPNGDHSIETMSNPPLERPWKSVFYIFSHRNANGHPKTYHLEVQPFELDNPMRMICNKLLDLRTNNSNGTNGNSTQYKQTSDNGDSIEKKATTIVDTYATA